MNVFKKYILQNIFKWFLPILPNKLDDLDKFFATSNYTFIVFLVITEMCSLNLFHCPKTLKNFVKSINFIGLNYLPFIFSLFIISLIALILYNRYSSLNDYILCKLITSVNLTLYIYLGLVFSLILSTFPILFPITIISTILITVSLFKFLKPIIENKLNVKITVNF